MENLNLTYSILKLMTYRYQNNINYPEEHDIVFIFDAYFVERYSDIFSNLNIKIASNGEELFYENNTVVMRKSKKTLHVSSDIFYKIEFPINMRMAIISKIIYNEFGLEINYVAESNNLNPKSGGRY